MTPRKCRRCDGYFDSTDREQVCPDCRATLSDDAHEELRREARHGGSSTRSRGGDAPEGLDPDDITRLEDEGWPFDDEDDHNPGFDT